MLLDACNSTLCNCRCCCSGVEDVFWALVAATAAVKLGLAAVLLSSTHLWRWQSAADKLPVLWRMNVPNCNCFFCGLL